METLTSLAETAVTILAPYLATLGEKLAEGAGRAALDSIQALYQYLKTRFERKPGAQEALTYLEANPGDEDAKAAMRVQILKQLKSDKEFAESLRSLLGQIEHDPAALTFITQIYGGKVGNIFNVNQIDRITFGKEQKTD